MAVQSGDTIKIHYHGRLTDGTTFDSSEGRSPLEFTVGSGSVIKGFDDGVKGMSVGEKKTIEIPFAEAYGSEDPSMIVEFPVDRLPDDLKPEIGMQLNMNNNSGQQFPVVITGITEKNIILNANHPLAGKDLIFDLELVEIVG
jgi:FKBP-type peptidyl-prolyl cis-trans isomerase 2